MSRFASLCSMTTVSHVMWMKTKETSSCWKAQSLCWQDSACDAQAFSVHLITTLPLQQCLTCSLLGYSARPDGWLAGAAGRVFVYRALFARDPCPAGHSHPLQGYGPGQLLMTHLEHVRNSLFSWLLWDRALHMICDASTGRKEDLQGFLRSTRFKIGMCRR